MQVERVDGAFVIDAALIGELLDVSAPDVPPLMRDRTITCVCETGIDADRDTFRLNIFHRTRHVRLRVDATGRVLQRSIIDLGEAFSSWTRRATGTGMPRPFTSVSSAD